MTDMLEDGQIWQAEQLQSYRAQNIVYTRDATSIDLTATLGLTKFDSSKNNRLTTKYVSRDFLVQVADLTMNGGLILPEKGDVITYNSKRYQVSSPIGEPCWTYCDEFNIMFRIHTKEIA